MSAAYRVDGEVVGAERFYAVACDPSQPVVIEACAGAGKTWMLVSRVLRALLQGARAQDVLAITFTRKAAAEMRARLQDWLQEFALSAPEHRVQALMQRGMSESDARSMEPKLAGLHEQLLDAGREVEVRTFHSWFGQLLRHAPMAVLEPLGLHADMQQIEDTSELANECWRPFLNLVHQDPGLKADFTALVQARSRHAVRQWLDAALQRRIEFMLADEAGVLEDSVPAAGQLWPDRALEQGWETVLSSAALQTLWVEAARALGASKGANDRKAGDGLAQALSRSGHAAYLQARAALFTLKGEPRKLLDDPSVRQAVTSLLELAQAEAQQRACDMHLRMVRLSRAWHQVYARLKRQRGLVDMTDLERCALHLLRDASLAGWMQEQLDARVRHLLIDEFQDTSPLQWLTLQSWLSAYGGVGGGAQAPSIFIVGDPKQSIYRFRGAEPKVFLAAQSFVQKSFGGRLLSCDHTRRNAPEVIAAVNASFEQVRQCMPYEAFRPHTTASAAVGAVYAHATHPRVAAQRTQPAESVWRESLTEARESPAEVRRMQEARQVAHHLALRIADGLAPSEVFVLARKRETLRLVGQALHELHVPHVAPEATRLMDTPEAADMLALLDVLVSPRHTLSLAQALRSPLFRCTDQDLLDLAQAAGRGRPWWTALVARDWPSGSPLARAATLLPRWREAADGLPPHDLLARIMAEGEVRERYAAAVPRESRGIALEHLDAMLALALDLDGGRYATPYSFVHAMRRRAADAPALARHQAVQLLTIHGAKGLEAELVCVVDADPELLPPETSTLLVDWPTEASHPMQVAFVASSRLSPPSLQGLRDREAQAQLREEFNALYVAMTRARRWLVFSATQPHRPRPAPGWPQVIAGLGLEPPKGREALVMPTRAVDVVNLRALPTWRVAAEPDRLADEQAHSAAASLGRVVHRAMEALTARELTQRSAAQRATDVRAAAQEFAVDQAVERAAAELVDRWLDAPHLAQWLDPARCAWAGNEHSLAFEGEVLRIDRLVRLVHPGEPDRWWVLDYKIEHRPQDRPEYLRQLSRYAQAVRGALRPSDPAEVRAAFVTGGGDFVPVLEPAGRQKAV